MRSLLADVLGRDADALARDPVRRVRQAVLAHLQLLFATPVGRVMCAPDFGVEDATRTFHEYPGSVARLRQNLEQTIRRYEPRLTQVAVRQLPTDNLKLLLRFEITALLLVEGRAVPVRFTSRLDSDSRIEVR
jgi:type VI secretion system protein